LGDALPNNRRPNASKTALAGLLADRHRLPLLKVARILTALSKRRRDNYVLPLRRRGGEMKAGWADSLIRRIREYSYPASRKNVLLTGSMK